MTEHDLPTTRTIATNLLSANDEATLLAAPGIIEAIGDRLFAPTYRLVADDGLALQIDVPWGEDVDEYRVQVQPISWLVATSYYRVSVNGGDHELDRLATLSEVRLQTAELIIELQAAANARREA